jgi:hypothetical protein
MATFGRTAAAMKVPHLMARLVEWCAVPVRLFNIQERGRVVGGAGSVELNHVYSHIIASVDL